MKEDDNFYDLFKESSESDRNYDFKNSGWDKINIRLNEDKARKRRKWLIFIPWIILPGLLIFSGLLYQQQQETNKKITALQSTTTVMNSTVHDTIFIEKHIYVHDTVYMFHKTDAAIENGSGKSIVSSNKIKIAKETTNFNDAIHSSPINKSTANTIAKVDDDEIKKTNSATIDSINNSTFKNESTVANEAGLKKNLSLTDAQFRQRTIETITLVQRAYWDLVYALRNLQIQRDAVKDARTQLEHNKRLVVEGVLAPIDVVAAEAQVAGFEQGVYGALEDISRAETI